jgi:hypothetical protein
MCCTRRWVLGRGVGGGDIGGLDSREVCVFRVGSSWAGAVEAENPTLRGAATAGCEGFGTMSCIRHAV